ncbi:MAG: calcium-binding protein [Selenomonadaceae bacterium]|nr:calcium-binding protein [Selenomonadaceae bacterium]
MATQLEVIQAFMKSLDTSKKSGEEALDSAVKAASPTSSKIKTFQDNTENKDIKSRFINDLKNSKSIEYFLRVYCGIDFNSKDSGAITGFDAGGTQIKDDADIILETNNMNTSFQNDSFSASYLNVELADNKHFSDLSDSEKFIWQGLYTWWIKGALDLIAESYGENFGFGKKSSATTNKIYVEFINNKKKDKLETSCSYNETTGETTEIKLTINMYYYKNLKSNVAKANSEFDRALAHELTHAVMMANILYLPVYRSLPGFITEGLSELTIGITNSNEDKIKALAADVSKFELGLDANDLARDESFMYEGGYIFFRYLARQFGDLTIANSKTANTLIQTFYGNDTVENSKNNVTITSGTGNDSIKVSGEKIFVYSEEGNNVIYLSENGANNRISVGSGNDSIYLSANTSKNTVISGEGKDTIYSGGENARIEAEDGSDYVYLHLDAKNNKVDGGNGSDTIISGAEKALINGDNGNDEIILYETALNNTVNGGDGSNYIYIYEKSSNHVINGGKDRDTVHSEGINISIDTGEGKDYIQLYAKDSTAEKSTVNSGAGDDSIYSGGATISVNAEAGDDYIHIYTNAKKNTINGGKGNDTIDNECSNGVLFQYVSGDGNDSIKGFTEKDTLSISGSDYTSQISGNDILINVVNSKITLDGAASLKNLNIGTLSGGLTVLTVTDKTKSPVTISSAIKTVNASKRTKAVKITGNKLANSIKGGSANDTIDGGNGNDTIYGGKGNDYIYGGSGNDYIFGEAGNDTLRGKSGNDTLTGGAGKDVFICGSGKEVITDYVTGTDKISLSAAITKTSFSGEDVIITMDKNSVTVKDAKAKKLSLIDSKGKSLSTIIGGLKTLTVTDSTKSPVTVKSAIQVIDASKRTTAVKITGNAIANSITGGAAKDTLYGGDGNDSIVGGKGNDRLYGDEGNDTLWGGAGNDTLWGDDGADVFIYASGEGKDTIYDFDYTDMLKITGAFSTSYDKSKKEIYFKVDSTANAITLKDFTAKTFNINGDSYKISGSKLVKK